LAPEDLAVSSDRFAIGNLIPKMTQVALETDKKELIRETPNFANEKFLYRLSRSDYEREWGKTYAQSGLGTRTLATLLRLVPPIGPFKGLGFKTPTTQTADQSIKSINRTTDDYRALLDAVSKDNLVLPNCVLDNGDRTAPGEYVHADPTYAGRLRKLTANEFDQNSAQLRDNILEFNADPSLPIETSRAPALWQTVKSDLSQLKAATPTQVSASDPAR
jgi:hypothetical protein